MWKRNLLFIGLIFGGAAALSASLFPPRVPAKEAPRLVLPPLAEQQAIVDAVNGAFRQQWSEQGLTPAARVAELTIMRRLALGLTGTIPSLQEIRQFEAQPVDRRLQWWLASTLHDRRYADYLAERLARAYVGTEDGPFLIYRRRRFVSWLSDELLQNRPYDQLVRELIAGKGIWTDQPSTNFVTVTYDPAKKEPNPERLAGRVARAFLGVRLDCAQCHDHPFQPWKQRDFQGLAAFFGQVHSGFTGIQDSTGKFEATNRKTGASETIKPHVPFDPELLPHEGSLRSQLALWVTNPKNPRMPRATVNRVWALLFGRALVEPVDDVASAGDPPRVLKLLADDFVAHGYDMQRLIRVIAATEAFKFDSAAAAEATEAQERAWADFPLTRLRSEQIVGAIIQSSSLETINQQSPILVRLARWGGQTDFVKRYGDTGEDELSGGNGTIPQRLLLMNGDLIKQKTKEDLTNSAARIALLAPSDHSAVETAYLSVFTRRPTADEARYFEARLANTKGPERQRRMSDIFWVLVNSTEFSWNH